jgi:uracil-DNA glycosylase family 4
MRKIQAAGNWRPSFGQDGYEVGMSKESEMRTIGKQILACKQCGLHKTRNKPVVGEGSLDAKIMFIGEAPGFNEDMQGQPFVGKAGEMLDELLASAGLERAEIYIANIMKCRPPKNRNPQPEEIKACTPYLDRQIAIIKPETICPMGNFAATYIMEKFGHEPGSIGRIHGRTFKVRNLLLNSRIIPLYHPASAVYNPNMKFLLLADFKSVVNE